MLWLAFPSCCGGPLGFQLITTFSVHCGDGNGFATDGSMVVFRFLMGSLTAQFSCTAALLGNLGVQHAADRPAATTA